MAPLHHSNLIRLIGACFDQGPQKLCIVLEFAERGSVKTVLGDAAQETTWKEQHFDLAYGTVRCLKYLHWDLRSPIIHRDIKADNVLVSETYTAKVADFGESRHYDPGEEEKSAHTMTMVGTPMYCAPEAR